MKWLTDAAGGQILAWGVPVALTALISVYGLGRYQGDKAADKKCETAKAGAIIIDADKAARIVALAPKAQADLKAVQRDFVTAMSGIQSTYENEQARIDAAAAAYRKGYRDANNQFGDRQLCDSDYVDWMQRQAVARYKRKFPAKGRDEYAADPGAVRGSAGGADNRQ